MIQPSHAQLNAAMASARQAIKDYSEMYSNMISDDVLEPIIARALFAALNIQPPKGTK